MTQLQLEILKRLLDHQELSFSAEKIAQQLGMNRADQFTPIVQALAQLERDKKVMVTDQGEFKAVIKPKTISGVFRGNAKGFGFVA